MERKEGGTAGWLSCLSLGVGISAQVSQSQGRKFKPRIELHGGWEPKKEKERENGGRILREKERKPKINWAGQAIGVLPS